MHIGAWIKEHPTETALAGGAILVGLYFLLHSGSSASTSPTSDYYNAEASLANQQAQYSAVQDQEQAQTQQTQIAADAQNISTLASLAAVKDQYDAQTNQASIAANVANTTTAAEENVANTQIGAQTTLGTNYINAETSAINSELQAETTARQNQYAFTEAFANNVNTFNGSQNRLAFLQSLLGQPSAASTTEMASAGINNPAYGTASQVGGILSGLGTFLQGLFA